jgi:hypothetical protein
LAEGRFLIPLVERSDGRPATIELSEVEWHLLLDGIVVRDRVLLRRHHRTVAAAFPPGMGARSDQVSESQVDVNRTCAPC